MNEIIDIREEGAENLQTAWNELLAGSSSSSIFLTWEWMGGWCSRLLRPYEKPLILTARKNGGLVGVAPLMLRIREDGEREIAFIGQDFSYGLDLIIAGSDRHEKARIAVLLVGYLFEQFSQKGTSFIFRHVAEDALLTDAMMETSGKYGLQTERGYSDPCRAVPLQATFQDYLKHGIRSQKLRSVIPAHLKKLEAEATVSFYLSPPSGFDQFWKELLGFHRETMIGRGKDSVLMDDNFTGHLASLASNWPGQGALRLCNLDLNGAPAVRLLAILHRSVFFAITMGINPAVRELFPGFNLAVLSQVYCIEKAIDDGCTSYDFLGGSAVYKARMGGKEHSGVAITVTGRPDSGLSLKREIALVTNMFLSAEDHNNLNTGGVEVWLLNMARLLLSSGNKPVIFQGSSSSFTTFSGGIEVVAISGKNRHAINRKIHEEIKKRNIQLIFYASSFVGEKYFIPGNVFIQHGIHWDYPTGEMGVADRLRWEWIRRGLARHDVKMARASRITIAVDTSFVNYYRTVSNDPDWASRVRYVPNFAIPRDKHEWQQKWINPEEIHLAFTRRFVLRRGIVLFAQVMENLLASYPHLRITLAGSGVYRPWAEEKFKGNSRVRICNLSHQEVDQLLKSVHIAVIPSTYSEGTSLACLEAMANGCAIVSTTTGGLGNLVMPGFNGLFARPEPDDFTRVLSQLIDNQDQAARMALNGYHLVQEAFSLTHWGNRIREALSGLDIFEPK